MELFNTFCGLAKINEGCFEYECRQTDQLTRQRAGETQTQQTNRQTYKTKRRQDLNLADKHINTQDKEQVRLELSRQIDNL